MARKLNRQFRQLLVKRMAEERNLPIEDLTVLRIELFTRQYSATPTHIGEVEVEYEPGKPWRAIYGFDALANVFIYAD